MQPPTELQQAQQPLLPGDFACPRRLSHTYISSTPCCLPTPVAPYNAPTSPPSSAPCPLHSQAMGGDEQQPLRGDQDTEAPPPGRLVKGDSYVTFAVWEAVERHKAECERMLMKVSRCKGATVQGRHCARV